MVNLLMIFDSSLLHQAKYDDLPCNFDLERSSTYKICASPFYQKNHMSILYDQLQMVSISLLIVNSCVGDYQNSMPVLGVQIKEPAY